MIFRLQAGHRYKVNAAGILAVLSQHESALCATLRQGLTAEHPNIR
jgi:hypothetical protein